MCAACVHGDRHDRLAAGSGNISNEMFRGEVVRSCRIDVTLSCSWRYRYPCPHFLRELWLIACWPVKCWTCSFLVAVQKKRIKS